MMGKKDKKRGAILVFVLGLVVLLGALCLRLMEETVQELRHVSQYHKRDDLRRHAYSLLDITVGVMQEFRQLDGNTLKTGGGWRDPLIWSNLSPLDSRVKWSVSFKGESGKLPLFSTNEKVLKEIFAVMHTGGEGIVDEDDGRPFYDAWMDWQDADDNKRDEGAEDEFYEDLITPYYTPGKDVQSFEEFRMIRGFYYDPDDPRNSGLFFDEFGNENENMKNFRKSFSFYHEGKVNICEASPFLLRYMSGDDDSLYDELLAYDPYGNKDFGSIDTPIAYTKGNNETFIVEIFVERGKARFELHIVLSVDQKTTPKSPANKADIRSEQNKKLNYPFRILRLRENENLID